MKRASRKSGTINNDNHLLRVNPLDKVRSCGDYSHMKRAFLVISLILTLGAMIVSCSRADKKKEIKIATADSVSVITLKKVAVNKKLTFPAELTPFEKAEIVPKVSGYIKDIKVDIGDHVKKGTVLAVLDAPEIVSGYAQVNSDVQAAHSKYLTSLDAYQRILNASKTEGTIAKGELESMKNQMLADSSSFEAVKSKLNANAQFKDYLTIRSPFDGIVTQRNADPGTLTGTNNSKPIFVIENSRVLRLRIPVPEIYTASIPDTTVIEFTVDAAPGKTYTAVLSRKSGSINLSNRAETWEFIYKNSDGQLKSGMFANATIRLNREGLSFLVPASAVATNLEKRFVIRLKDGKAEWIDVKNGFSQNDKVEIFGALNEGDQLLVAATDEIKPGTKLIAKMK